MPTILYLNGLAIPDYVDCDVLTGVIQEDYLRRHPIERTDQSLDVQPGAGEMTQEEKELLEKHLRALGYF